MDSGLPFRSTMNLGFGIKSVQKKLQLMFPGEATIEFINQPQKMVQIYLPFNQPPTT